MTTAIRHSAFLLGTFLVFPLGNLFASQADAPIGKPLAWVQFRDAGEAYAGESYLWLEDGDVEVVIDVIPQRDHVLEVRWGSKDDSREAIVVVNTHRQTITHGGYDGFRWMPIKLDEALKGERYTVTFQRATGKAAFIAAVRLRTRNAKVAEELPKAAAHQASYSTSRPTRPAAFPAMQKLWETPLKRTGPPLPDAKAEAAFQTAEKNGRLAAEQFYRCRKFVEGWLKQADPTTGLIPRNLTRDKTIWNAKDSAADNYPFMVLTAALTDRSLFAGRMREMLETETRLTSRIDRLPDTWSFTKQAFQSETPKLDSIIFGGSEYVKDGLLPLTEWLGESPWQVRMLGIVDDIWKHAPIETPFGKIPSTNVEVNGEMLQALSRIYWMTGDEKYLEWAIRLGDYYLLGDQHPTRNIQSLRLRDHGCEITSGLSELYASVNFKHPEKKRAYEEPMHAMYDRILKVARNEHGMLYNTFNPNTGEHDKRFCDTWGYNYNGIYTVYLIDGTEPYREAVRFVLGNLKEHLTDHHWGSADEYADSIEGAINLYNRERVASAADWIDTEIKDMWSVQRPDGIVEGWHGDGNSARTAIMYATWKTQGLTLQPWRADVRVGAVRQGDALYVSVVAEKPYEGRIVFDQPRHKTQMHLPLDYPRINQFPEWYTIERGRQFTVRDPAGKASSHHSGETLLDGLPVKLEAVVERRLIVSPR